MLDVIHASNRKGHIQYIDFHIPRKRQEAVYVLLERVGTIFVLYAEIGKKVIHIKREL